MKAFAKGCGGKLLNVQNYEESDVAVVFGVLKKEKKTTHYRGEIILKQLILIGIQIILRNLNC